jgi:alpha-amylase
MEILRTVPYEEGFHFYTAHGSYSGETATGLDAFEKKIQVVPDASIRFHLQRGDFQKWIKDTLGDAELAKRAAR